MFFQKGLALVLLLIIPLIAAIGIFVIFSSPPQTEKPLSEEIQNFLRATSAPAQTPFPFQELTIPYLRNREYKSQLGELTKYSDNSNYTSYLTSYSSDGLKINGLLTIPKSPEPADGFSAIIFVHGYIPPTQYNTTQNYSSYVDYLSRNGFVVFKIDLRGHADSEGEPGGAYYSEDYVVDTLNAYSALQNSEYVNPAKIGLWGHSMAGNVTFRSFIVNGNIPALAVWAGAGYTYSDLTEYRISDDSYRPPAVDSPRARERQKLRETYGDFNPDSEFWKQVVPTNYLAGISGHISLHHAANDDVVSINYSRNLITVLERSQIEANLTEYPSGGHNLSGSTFTQAMQDTVEFFRNNL